MDLTYLKTFVEVVQTGSFTKAAENLCISQPAVSRRIQYMEKQYKCKLLDRTGSLLTPTEKGRVLLDKALKLTKMEQDLELGMGMSSVETGDSLSFISTPSFSNAFLPQIMSRFVKNEKKVSNLAFDEDMPDGIREKLRRGDFEIAVIEHCPDFDLREFKIVPLPNDALVFVTASEIEFSGRQPQFEELLGHPFLSCSNRCCTRVILERNLQSKGYAKEDFKQFMETADLEILLKLLQEGVGISFLPLVLVQPFVDRGQLKTYRFDDLLHYRKRSLVMPAATLKSDLAHRFAEEIITFFEEDKPDYVI